MTIIREQDAPRFGQDGVEVTGLASPSRGCDTVSAWRVLLAPGAGSPEHTLTSDEAFVALRGSARVQLDGEPQELRAGNCLVVAPERRFTIAMTARSPSKPSAAWPPAGRRSSKARTRPCRRGQPERAVSAPAPARAPACPPRAPRAGRRASRPSARPRARPRPR